jgi:hypothetical protein
VSIVLNNVNTANAFPTEGAAGGVKGALIVCGPMAVAQINVYNASVFMQVSTERAGESGQAVWQPEEFRAPSEFVIVRRYIMGLQFRSAKEGVPAQVSAVLVPEGETWLSYLAAQGGAPA